ncbi:hypothetical protein [Hydrogenimonas sp.]|uniref:hypothetical protein n=1 Tax=Hydrogenimonas sp. TaxID=2231112 RepID=UPI002624EA8D|nr:hypothetical protein [Hydrogenimonas sp.]
MIRLPIFFAVLVSALSAATEFVPKGESHPIVLAVKIIGMAATLLFVIVMVVKSVRIVKDDEDDHVQLPD